MTEQITQYVNALSNLLLNDNTNLIHSKDKFDCH